MGLKDDVFPRYWGILTPTERKRLWDPKIFKGNELKIGPSWIDSGLRTGPDQELKFNEYEPFLELNGASFIGLSKTKNELQKGHLRDMDAADLSVSIRDKEKIF